MNFSSNTFSAKALDCTAASHTLGEFAKPLSVRRGCRWLTIGAFGFAAVASMLLPSLSRAGSLDSLTSLGQAQFKMLTENAAAATHYKALAPAEPLGIIGFDVAIELSSTEIDESVFDAASNGDFGIGTFLLPRLHVHKGLPFGLDVGAFYTSIPDTDFTAMGAELRYALLKGTTVTPAVAVRATYSVIGGVDQMDLTNTGLEATISKGFIMLTPYAGVGVVRSVGTPKGIATLQEESVDLKKFYAGININLGFNFGLEFDQTGDYRTYSAKAGFRF